MARSRANRAAQHSSQDRIRPPARVVLVELSSVGRPWPMVFMPVFYRLPPDPTLRFLRANSRSVGPGLLCLDCNPLHLGTGP